MQATSSSDPSSYTSIASSAHSSSCESIPYSTDDSPPEVPSKSSQSATMSRKGTLCNLLTFNSTDVNPIGIIGATSLNYAAATFTSLIAPTAACARPIRVTIVAPSLLPEPCPSSSICPFTSPANLVNRSKRSSTLNPCLPWGYNPAMTSNMSNKISTNVSCMNKLSYLNLSRTAFPSAAIVTPQPANRPPINAYCSHPPLQPAVLLLTRLSVRACRRRSRWPYSVHLYSTYIPCLLVALLRMRSRSKTVRCCLLRPKARRLNCDHRRPGDVTEWLFYSRTNKNRKDVSFNPRETKFAAKCYSCPHINVRGPLVAGDSSLGTAVILFLFCAGTDWNRQLTDRSIGRIRKRNRLSPCSFCEENCSCVPCSSVPGESYKNGWHRFHLKDQGRVA